MKSIVAFRSMLALMAAVVVALATPAAAQDARWPSRPVKIVVTFPPGGTSDLVARLLAPKLSTAFGQQFIVENRPGAAGIIGADVVAKSAPDGHTLLISTVGSHGIAPTLNRNIKYDAMADFTHIALIGSTAHVLLVSPKLPAKSLQEFIALAKSKPGKIDFGSGGTGTINHIAGELFKTKAGIDITHVSYKGSGAGHHRSARQHHPGGVRCAAGERRHDPERRAASPGDHLGATFTARAAGPDLCGAGLPRRDRRQLGGSLGTCPAPR